VLEKALEAYGTDLLELDGWRTLKTDPVSRKEWGKGFGELGMADRLYIRYEPLGHATPDILSMAQVLWIEWKRIRPGRLAAMKAQAHQKLWIEAERSRGALVWLAGVDFTATPEGFFTHYKDSGLLRRKIK
jgi:hypothetical protein